MDCSKHLDSLVAEFRRSFILDESSEPNMWGTACKLDTPFFLPDLSPISLYIEQDENGVLITDRGETSDHLFVSGISRRKINRELETIRQKLGLDTEEDEVSLRLNPRMERSGIAVLLSAISILASEVSGPTAPSEDEFEESISRFLAQSGVSYDRDVPAIGKTQEFPVDFVVETENYRQLPLWIFNPARPQVSRRVRDLVFYINDIDRLKHSDIEIAPPRIIVRSGYHIAPGSSAQTGLLSLEEYVPSSLVHWDIRKRDHKVQELLRTTY